MTASNCLFFAVALYRRRRSRGRIGYLMARRSRWGAFPHFLYAEWRHTGTLRIVSYRPLSPKPRALPPPLFNGGSRWGDL